MGKVGRIACIATPGVLTVASLICLLMVFLAGLNKHDANLRSLYFFKADTTALKQNVTKGIKIAGHEINNDLLNAFTSSVSDKKLDDWYEVYLWNYCSGTNTSSVPTYCSKRTASFYFDPLDVWGLNDTALTKAIPKEINTGLSAYKKASKWLFAAYTVAFWSTVGAFGAGFLAICSRWGSFVTALVSGVATLFTVLAAITSTVMFSTLTGAFNTALKGYGVHLSVGTKQLALDWIAVCFSVAASLFWFVSICCCSGKSSNPYRKDAYAAGSGRRGIFGRGRGGEKAASERSSAYSVPFGNRGYQPLEGNNQQQQSWGAATHGGASGHEMQDFGGSSPYKGRETAYEPFRHERV